MSPKMPRVALSVVTAYIWILDLTLEFVVLLDIQCPIEFHFLYFNPLWATEQL